MNDVEKDLERELSTKPLKQGALPKCPTPRCKNVRELRDPFCGDCWGRIDGTTRRALHVELKRIRGLGQKRASALYVRLMIECIRKAFVKPEVAP